MRILGYDSAAVKVCSSGLGQAFSRSEHLKWLQEELRVDGEHN